MLLVYPRRITSLRAALRHPSAHTYRLLIFKERLCVSRRSNPRSAQKRDYEGLFRLCQVAVAFRSEEFTATTLISAPLKLAGSPCFWRPPFQREANYITGF